MTIPTGFLPMLASQCKDMTKLKFPVMASPKIDGYRAHVFASVVYSRNLKPIRNLHVQKLFGVPEMEGFDGELAVGPITAPDVFRVTASGVTRKDGEPKVFFHAFDLYGAPGGFYKRFPALRAQRKSLSRLSGAGGSSVQLVPHKEIDSLEELLAYEEECLEQGYEGIMVRSLFGPYKCGRATEKEGHLLKIKRFFDSEATILGTYEQDHNNNVAEVNELGRTKRSSHKAGKVAAGVLGGLHVRDVKSGVEFYIGGGFDAAECAAMWEDRENLIGKLAKYKYFPLGSKDKPRFPTFLGIRDPDDT